MIYFLIKFRNRLTGGVVIKKYNIGILRVLTIDDKEVLELHQNILKNYLPEFNFETRCIPNQYKGLYNKDAHDKAFPDIIKIAKEWENEIDGLIISCADDPGVNYLKKELSIPVIGAGSSVACLSMLYDLKVGIIGIEQKPPENVINLIGERISGYIVPEGVVNTNDLQTEEGKKAILDSAYKLKDMGAEIIIFACTGLTTAGAIKIIKEVELPVVDGVIAEGLAMKALLINKEYNGNY
ncbi:MAG: aspartate/glutamate racemase family protein [Sedimentibacter sp.]